MLTSVQAAHAHRFAVSPRGGFSVPDVDRLRARVVATLASYEGTGTPGRDGLTAAALGDVVLPSVFAEPGYAMLGVQDFLDEVHETLAAFEQREAFPSTAPLSAQTSWTPAPAPQPSSTRAPARVAQTVPRDQPQPRDVPLPRNVTPAIRALAAVGGGSAQYPQRPQQPAYAVPVSAPPAAARVEPERSYGMDADALVFELQSAAAQSRARGTLQVTVQVPGQQLRVMRVVESTPGIITIVAQ